MSQQASGQCRIGAETAVPSAIKSLVTKGTHATHRRSVAKAVCWRALGSLDTFMVSWFVTGQPHLGAAIAGTELVTKIGLYYFHERAWAHITWGLRHTDAKSAR